MDTHPAPALSIFQAAEEGDLATVQRLISTGAASVDERQHLVVGDGFLLRATVLHHAAYGGQKKVVEFLLSNQAEVDAEYRAGTPLTVAIIKGHADITELLLAHGADPNNSDRNLRIAVKQGHTTIIEQLLRYGASPNAQSSFDHGRTPLHLAIHRRRPMAILKLYPYADATLMDEHNLTPADYLIKQIAEPIERNGFQSVIQWEQSGRHPKNMVERMDMLCLYAFLCAGGEINEALISRRVTDTDLSPVISKIIQEAITVKEQIEKQFNYPKPDIVLRLLSNFPDVIKVKAEIEKQFNYPRANIVLHLLLQSPERRAALLEEKAKLEGLGYHQRSGIHRFFFTPEEGKKDFLSSQEVFLDPSLRKKSGTKGRSILDLPPELLQMSLEKLLRPASYLDELKSSIDHDVVTTYTPPNPS
jgi:hypothetical protein